MKSVLISIQPKWCDLIFAGKKTVEIRRSRPKLEAPFKVYIYCTKDKHGWFDFGKKERLDGKVIGEFVCKKIDKYPRRLTTFQDTVSGSYISKSEVSETCLSISELNDYFMGAAAYFWHISDLTVYDKPKELRNFSTIDKEAVKACENRERAYNNPDLVNGALLPGGYVCVRGEIDWCSDCKKKSINRPPQSWCYVEDV